MTREELFKALVQLESNDYKERLTGKATIINLINAYCRLEKEAIGLRQTVKNFKEKQEKFFGNNYYQDKV